MEEETNDDPTSECVSAPLPYTKVTAHVVYPDTPEGQVEIMDGVVVGTYPLKLKKLQENPPPNDGHIRFTPVDTRQPHITLPVTSVVIKTEELVRDMLEQEAWQKQLGIDN